MLTFAILQEAGQCTDVSQCYEMVLARRRLTAIEPLLQECASLRMLDLSFNQIESIANLDRCLDLRLLALQCNELQKISGLEKMAKLETLKLNSNRIPLVEGVAHLRQLKTLWLQRNPLRNPLPSNCFPTSLTSLNLSYTGITTLSCLSSLIELTQLSLTNNQLEDRHLSPLSKLSKLEELDLNGNLLQSLPVAFEKCLTRLDRLHLAHNRFRSVSTLPRLTSVNYLTFASNALTDVVSLVRSNMWDRRRESRKERTSLGLIIAVSGATALLSPLSLSRYDLLLSVVHLL